MGWSGEFSRSWWIGASPDDFGGEGFGTAPSGAQTGARGIAKALDLAGFIPHGMGTEHGRFVFTESHGQARVRRACRARPMSRNTEIDYGFTKETTESEDQQA